MAPRTPITAKPPTPALLAGKAVGKTMTGTPSPTVPQEPEGHFALSRPSLAREAIQSLPASSLSDNARLALDDGPPSAKGRHLVQRPARTQGDLQAGGLHSKASSTPAPVMAHREHFYRLRAHSASRVERRAPISECASRRSRRCPDSELGVVGWFCSCARSCFIAI